MASQNNKLAQDDAPKRKPKGGAPKKPVDQRKAARFEVRCTASEKATIQANAAQAGMTPSDFARMRCLGSSTDQKRKTAKTPEPKTDPQLAALIHEINAIGNNWNQLTRAFHRKGHVPAYMDPIGEDLRRILSLLLEKLEQR